MKNKIRIQSKKDGMWNWVTFTSPKNFFRRIIAFQLKKFNYKPLVVNVETENVTHEQKLIVVKFILIIVVPHLMQNGYDCHLHNVLKTVWKHNSL